MVSGDTVNVVQSVQRYLGSSPSLPANFYNGPVIYDWLGFLILNQSNSVRLRAGLPNFNVDRFIKCSKFDHQRGIVVTVAILIYTQKERVRFLYPAPFSNASEATVVRAAAF